MQGAQTQKKPSLFILLLLVSFGMVSAVLFTPALPQIAQQLGISDNAAELTITVYLIGYAFGFLPYGPLSDRFGRKPAVYTGILIAIAGCLLTLLAGKLGSFSLLLFGRLLAALGSSAGLKIAFTMVGDTCQHERATKAVSYLMMAFAVGPALAIGIGGVLATYFGWESCFYFQTGYSILLLILAFFLPETAVEKDLNALKMETILSGFLKKIKNKKLVCCGLLTGCGASLYYLFAAESPFIGIVRLGLTPDEFGLYSFIPPVGLFLGALFANLLAGKMEQLAIIFYGILIAFAFSALMFILFALGAVNPWTLFIPMPVIFIGESLVYANATSLILTHAQNKSYASAVINFLTIGLCVLSLSFSELLPAHGPVVMPLIFTGTTILMLFLLMRLRSMLKAEK